MLYFLSNVRFTLGFTRFFVDLFGCLINPSLSLIYVNCSGKQLSIESGFVV